MVVNPLIEAQAASYMMSSMIGFIGAILILFIVLGICMLFYKMIWPSVRYNNYLMCYKIGRLVKHAKEKDVQFVFERKPREELQRIDEQFEYEVGDFFSKEKEEINKAYKATKN